METLQPWAISTSCLWNLFSIRQYLKISDFQLLQAGRCPWGRSWTHIHSHSHSPSDIFLAPGMRRLSNAFNPVLCPLSTYFSAYLHCLLLFCLCSSSLEFPALWALPVTVTWGMTEVDQLREGHNPFASLCSLPMGLLHLWQWWVTVGHTFLILKDSMALWFQVLNTRRMFTFWNCVQRRTTKMIQGLKPLF